MAQDDSPQAVNRYAVACANLRSTAKWLTASFAGVGGLLVAGVQLTGLGKLGHAERPRLVLAVAGLALALAAVAYLVAQTVYVLTDGWVTATELTGDLVDGALGPGTKKTRKRKKEAEIVEEGVNAAAAETFGHVAPSLNELHRALRQVNEGVREKVQSLDVDVASLERLMKHVEITQSAAERASDCATYLHTRQRFRVLVTKVVGGGAVVALGVTLFAYAANPESDNPTDVRVVLTPASASPIKR